MDTVAKIYAGYAVFGALGDALGEERRYEVSALIAAGPEKFIAWSKTDAGRDAVRAMFDAFVGAHK